MYRDFITVGVLANKLKIKNTTKIPMHRYNNMDHSMLTAMEAVQNIKNNITTKENIWTINSETDYHESK